MFTLAGSAALAQSAPPVEYEPSALIGVVFTFGGGGTDVGITAKLISTNEPDHFAGVAGVTYYPWASNPWGVDLGFGYARDGIAGTLSWDFLQGAPQAGFGWLLTRPTRAIDPD